MTDACHAASRLAPEPRQSRSRRIGGVNCANVAHIAQSHTVSRSGKWVSTAAAAAAAAAGGGGVCRTEGVRFSQDQGLWFSQDLLGDSTQDNNYGR